MKLITLVDLVIHNSPSSVDADPNSCNSDLHVEKAIVDGNLLVSAIDHRALATGNLISTAKLTFRGESGFGTMNEKPRLCNS